MGFNEALPESSREAELIARPLTWRIKANCNSYKDLKSTVEDTTRQNEHQGLATMPMQGPEGRRRQEKQCQDPLTAENQSYV